MRVVKAKLKLSPWDLLQYIMAWKSSGIIKVNKSHQPQFPVILDFVHFVPLFHDRFPELQVFQRSRNSKSFLRWMKLQVSCEGRKGRIEMRSLRSCKMPWGINMSNSCFSLLKVTLPEILWRKMSEWLIRSAFPAFPPYCFDWILLANPIWSLHKVSLKVYRCLVSRGASTDSVFNLTFG